MKKLGIILSSLGFIVLLYSSMLKPYTNEDEYNQKYYAIEGEKRFKEFYQLREIYLTEKYLIEDYGITILIVGLFIFTLFYKGDNSIKIPNTKLKIGLIGFVAVLVSVLGYIGDLFLGMVRGDFPHWADSLIIPLAAVPIIFITLLVWFFLNLIGLINPFKAGVQIKEFQLNNINYWFLFLVIIALITTIITIFYGDFWLTTAGLIWSYFYFCLLVGKRSGKIYSVYIHES